MIITLKNNKNIKLEWNFLVLEYLEEYETPEGRGIVQLERDIKMKKNLLKINNIFVYALVSACSNELLTYRDTLRLVKVDDYSKIIEFIKKNTDNYENFKKKGKKYTQAQRKKKCK